MKAPPIQRVELFDYARIIGAHIDFSGGFADNNTFCNANLHLGGWPGKEIGPQSLFGRSDKADLDEALADLALELEARGQITFMDDKRTTYHVPPLKHTPGYRGKRVHKKPAKREAV